MKKLVALLLVITLLLGNTACVLADSVRIKEGSNPNVRTKPNGEGDIIGNAKSGQTYELVDESGNWYKIRLNDGKEGWIAGGMAERIKTDGGTKSQSASQQQTAAPAAAPAAAATATPDPSRVLNRETAVAYYSSSQYYNGEFSIYYGDEISLSGEAITVDQYGFECALRASRKPSDKLEIRILPETAAINGVPVKGVWNDQQTVIKSMTSTYSDMLAIDNFIAMLNWKAAGIDYSRIEWIEFDFEIKITPEGQSTKEIRKTMQFVATEPDLSFEARESQAVTEVHVLLNEYYPEDSSTLIVDQNGVKAWLTKVTYTPEDGCEILVSFENSIGAGWDTSAGWNAYSSSASKDKGVARLNGDMEAYYKANMYIEGGLKAHGTAQSALRVPSYLQEASLPQELTSVSFDIRFMNQVDPALGFETDRITVHVEGVLDPDLAAVHYSSPGTVWHKDGTLAFTFGKEYHNVNSFVDGLSVVYYEESKVNRHYGVIDKDGKIVVPLEYEMAKPQYADGLLAVRKDGKWGYIDNNGNMVIEPQYDQAYNFTDGIAVVFYGTVTSSGAADQGTFFFIDRDNQKLDALGEWTNAYVFNAAGYARVNGGDGWGMINREGDVIVEPVWDATGTFNNGFTYVAKDKLFGIVDESGKLICDPVFDQSIFFSPSGVALVKEQGKYHLIDAQMNTVADLSEYKYVSWYNKAEYAVCYMGEQLNEYGTPDGSNQAYCLVDSQGNKVIPFLETDSYYHLEVYQNHRVVYSKPYDPEKYGDESNRTGMIDFSGNVIIPFRYTEMCCISSEDDLLFLTMYRDTESRSNVIGVYSLTEGEIGRIDYAQTGLDHYYFLYMNYSDGLMVQNPPAD